MTEPEKPSSLNDLDRRLKEAQARHQIQRDRESRGRGRAANSGLGLGFRIVADLVAALIVGIGIGLLLDRWLGTSPWMLILFFFLGSAAGMLNVYRTASGQGYAVGYRADDRPENKRTNDKPETKEPERD